MRSRRLIWFFLILIIGCDAGPKVTELEQKLNESNSQLHEELRNADAKIEGLQSQLTEMKKNLETIESSRKWDEFVNDMEKTAMLTPGDSGYSVIRFDLGMLTIRLEDVKPYANGSKIKLVFGNILSSSLDGLTAKIQWGPVDEGGRPNYFKAKSKEIKLTRRLIGGYWNKVSIVLEGTPPSELGFVQINNVAHSGIHLNAVK